MDSKCDIAVLYAEDDEDSALMLKTLLAFEGIHVSLARSVNEAYQAAADGCFDAYLLDSFFPDGSGLELCRRLDGFRPRVPIIFYSGAAFPADRRNGLAAGADAYLVKPEFEAVAATIFGLVGRQTVGDRVAGPRHSTGNDASSVLITA